MIADYGGTDDRGKGEDEATDAKDQKEAGDVAISKPLMQEEDRNTGQIQWHIYGLYMNAAGGILLCLLILFALLAEQAAQGTQLNIQLYAELVLNPDSVVTTLILGWWTSRSIAGFQNAQYMGLYAGVGGAQAVIAFVDSFAFSYVFQFHSQRSF